VFVFTANKHHTSQTVLQLKGSKCSYLVQRQVLHWHSVWKTSLSQSLWEARHFLFHGDRLCGNKSYHTLQTLLHVCRGRNS